MTWADARKKFSAWNVASNVLRCRPWNLVWRDGAMTPPIPPTAPATSSRAFARIEQYLALISRSPEGNATVERFGAAGATLAGVHDLEGFLCLSRTRGKRFARQNLRATLQLAPADEVAALCVLALLRPTLARMSTILARRQGDREEAEAAVVAISWEVVRAPRSRPHEAPEAIIDAIWTEVRRRGGLRRRGEYELVPLHDVDVLMGDRGFTDRFPDLLEEAVIRGVLTARQAWIVGRTRIDERTLTEVAAGLGHSYEAVRQERRRAEARLRTFALSYVSSATR